MVQKFKDKYLKKLQGANELILILKNLMWLRDNMRWESKLSEVRRDEYEQRLQANIMIVVRQLLSDIKKNVEEKDKLEEDK